MRRLLRFRVGLRRGGGFVVAAVTPGLRFRLIAFRAAGFFLTADFGLAAVFCALDRTEGAFFLELARLVAVGSFRARGGAAFLALTFRDDGFCRFISEPPRGTPGFSWCVLRYAGWR